MTRSGMKPIMTLTISTLMLAVIPISLPVMAQDITPPPESVEVGQYAFCTAVEDHQPVNPAESFPADVGKVYLWTSILNPGTKTEITHVWYRGDIQVGEVPLAVRFSRTRTWSTKTILPSQTGAWHVDVVDANDNVLGSYAFTITEAMQ